MMLAPGLVDEILSACRALQSDAGDAAAGLRARFPDLKVLRCEARDVGEAPFAAGCAFDLHLVDLAAHCVSLTQDPSRASGVLIATHD